MQENIRALRDGNYGGDINEECAEFFRTTPGFHRFMLAIKEKYRSLGTIGGTIHLRNLNEEEKVALTGLLRRDYLKETQATIKLSKVMEALEQTKYQEVDFLKVLQSYWGKEIFSRKEKLAKVRDERQQYFKDIEERLVGQGKKWLKNIIEQKDNAYKILMGRYAEDSSSLEKDLEMISLALEKLPVLTGKRKQLAIFSSLITSDPHYFDSNTSAGQLLIYALSYVYSTDKPTFARGEKELLYKAGLYGTEITNSTVCSGLLGYLDGKKVHPGWLGFYENGEPLEVSLGNLVKVDKIVSPLGFVLLVENPSILPVLSQRTLESYGVFLPIVCSNGQVNIATLTLLDCLEDQNTHLYYSGDFDPEGLLIANRLKERYPKLNFLGYGEDDYRASLSKQKINQRRLCQLKRLDDETLRQIANLMEEIGYAGYQEVIIDNLWTYTRTLLEKYLPSV